MLFVFKFCTNPYYFDRYSVAFSFIMDAIQGYGSSDEERQPTEDEVLHLKPLESKMSLVVNTAPDVMIPKEVVDTRIVDPDSKKQVMYNPTYEEMWAPKQVVLTRQQERKAEGGRNDQLALQSRKTVFEKQKKKRPENKRKRFVLNLLFLIIFELNLF